MGWNGALSWEQLGHQPNISEGWSLKQLTLVATHSTLKQLPFSGILMCCV